jgi:3-hydroxyacyl-CoA dehydrogenase
VAKSLETILPPDDAFHAVAGEIPVMKRMIDEGHIGNKGGKGGFYDSRDVRSKKTLDLETFTYRDFDNRKPAVAVRAEAAGDFTLLLDGDDRYGRYAWEVLSSTLCYAAELVPDVNESLVAIDDAMKLGYNWIQGPFEMMDAIGTDRLVARLEAEGKPVPSFLKGAAGKPFYEVDGGALCYRLADGTCRELKRAPGVIRFSERRRTLSPELENDAASYFLLNGDIGLVEFHSKANTLDGDSMQLIADSVAHASDHCRALIIHNDAQHFSCGVNLEGVLDFVVREDWDGIDAFLDHFQQTVLSLRRAPIPVIAAPSGLSLGGGFEVVLHTDKTIYHANSVTGLVETLVGVVPGGGGVKEMLYRWAEARGDVTRGAWQAFMNVGYGKTARSPLEAMDLAMFRPGVDDFVMNRDRLLASAMSAADELAPGYSPTTRKALAMPGRDAWQQMQEWLANAHDKGHLTPHDVTTGSQVAMIVTGGDVDAGTVMSEQDLLDLERKAFVTLAKTPQTRARIEHMLEFGSPLRN